jgi:hypothetical protein
MSPSLIGVLVGVALGFAAAFGGFSAFAIVTILAVIGFAAGKVVEGDLDLSPYLSGRSRSRR